MELRQWKPIEHKAQSVWSPGALEYDASPPGTPHRRCCVLFGWEDRHMETRGGSLWTDTMKRAEGCFLCVCVVTHAPREWIRFPDCRYVRWLGIQVFFDTSNKGHRMGWQWKQCIGGLPQGVFRCVLLLQLIMDAAICNYNNYYTSFSVEGGGSIVTGLPHRKVNSVWNA